MKLLFILVYFAIVSAGCSTCIYVVRQAEKQTGGSNAMMTANPELSAAGKERAEALAAILVGKKLHAVFCHSV